MERVGMPPSTVRPKAQLALGTSAAVGAIPPQFVSRFAGNLEVVSMVIPRRHLKTVLCCAGFAALVLLLGSVPTHTASARPYVWSDFGPSSGSGDPTGDDQPSPTPKPSKAASVHTHGGSVAGGPY